MAAKSKSGKQQPPIYEVGQSVTIWAQTFKTFPALQKAFDDNPSLKKLDNPWKDDDKHRAALLSVINEVFAGIPETKRPTRARAVAFAANFSKELSRLAQNEYEFAAALDAAIEENDADWRDKIGVVLPPWNADKETRDDFWKELAGLASIPFSDVKAAGENLPREMGAYIKGKLAATKSAAEEKPPIAEDGETPTADSLGENSWLTARDFATIFRLTKGKAEALRKALEKWKADSPTEAEGRDWQKNEKKGPRDSQFSYRVGAVRHILRKYITS